MPVGIVMDRAAGAFHRPGQVIKYVHEMAELGEQAAPVKRFLTPPGTLRIIVVPPVPEAVYLDQVKPAQPALADELFHSLHGRVIPVLLYCEYEPSRIRCG